MSSASQATGKRRRAEDAAAGSARSAAGKRKPAEPLRVPLQHARWSHFGWMLFGLVLGGLLILKLGVVGKGIGAVLLGVAGHHGHKFVKTLLKPAGTITVTRHKVELPRGLCKGEDESCAPGDITHVFLLRRAVPWTTTGPLLVIEAGDRRFTYPRDWFASDADQRAIIRAIQLHQEKRSGS